jgi:hypothetical protein
LEDRAQALPEYIKDTIGSRKSEQQWTRGMNTLLRPSNRSVRRRLQNELRFRRCGGRWRSFDTAQWRPAPDKHNEYVSPFVLR